MIEYKKKIKHNLKQNFIILFLAILSLAMFLLPSIGKIAFAVDLTYTNVLKDLQKDENFKTEDFPVNYKDYSLQVITIAENVNNELFVYVYQPSEIYTATSINISLTSDNKLNYTNYKLELLNKDGVFFKYKVNNLVVKQAPYRYYEISNIYRAFDNSVDDDADNDNTITEKGFNVGKSFVFVGSGNELQVHMQDVETIEITSKYVGFLRFSGGIKPPWDIGEDLDAHFVAFSTDKDIDNLMEAEVYYRSQVYKQTQELILGTKTAFEDIQENYSYIKSDDFVDWTGDGWFSEKYSFERIQTTSEFFKDEKLRDYTYSAGLFNVSTQSKLTDKAFNDIKQMSWVLRFAETSYLTAEAGSVIATKGTIVSDVSILRLKFLNDGVVYNLGIIDNKQTGTGQPDNTTEQWLELPSWLQTIIKIFIVLIVIFLVVVVIKIIWSIITFIFNKKDK